MREWHRDDTLPVVIFAHSMGISQSSHSVIDAEVASIAEGEAETARKSLHEAVDQTLRIHSRRREFSAALQDMATCVSVHLRKYKHLPECREQILNQSARFLAGAELPSRTDYSLVDPTGKENAKEESYHRAWKRRLPDIVSDPADLSEVGKRAIALLSEQFRDQTSSSLPHPDSEAVWQYLREVIKIKHHLGVKISRGDPNVIESLIACLPALIENDNYCKLLRCFPEVFDERQQVVSQAMSEYLSRALQELELRWYGDFSKRLARLLDTKDNREIVESAADKEIALRILERVWGWGDDTQQRLVKSFNITSSELKNSIITGLCTELRDWTFKASEAAWYSSALKSIGIFMATHEISAQELSFDAARTLPVVLNAGSLEVVHAYLKTFSLPVSVLASQELHPQFTELIEDALQAPSRGSERMPVAQYEALRELSAQGHKETILGALQRVGNRTLEESEVYGIDRLIEYIHQNPTSFNKSLFTDGAKRLAHAKLSSADLKAAQLVAREFKVDLTSPEFKAAAVEGVTTIFKRAIGAKWDKPLFDALTKECGLNGVIDDSHLRETLKPIITLELLDGSARALNRVNWLLKRFHFKEPMPGAELREATMHAISSAICNGNGPVIRMLCTRMASELTTQDIVGVVKDAWHSPEGKRGCLENLRYLPDAVKHQLNRSLAFADYERDVGVAGAITYDRYMELRSTGRDIELKSFIKAVRREMDSLISSAPQDLQALQNKPHYRELTLTIFPNNWGPDASFESTESCQDRSGDLAGFRIRKGQGFTLAEGVTMRVKAGLEYDEDAALETDELISNCMQGLASGGYSRTSLRKTLLKSLEIEPSSAKTEENFQKKVFSVALHALSEGSSPLSLEEIVIRHRLVEFADARDFMRGTQSRIEQAPNRDYANLLELQSFFGDHLRESINHMVQTALKDPAVKAGAQEYYIATSQEQAAAQTALIISKYRPDRLGLSEYFREQCLREIQRERNGLGDAVDIDSIIESFERVALGQDSSDPQLLQFSEQFRKKMGGIVGSHRARTHEFLREIGYSQFQDALLSEINIPELLSNRNKLTVASADQKMLEDYFTELLHQQCSPRIDKLTKELQKFEPDSDSPVSAARRRVNCFITKNHTSAHARKTAGVCVSIDNPARVTEGEKNLWDMPNYFQMVLQDDVKKTCLGAVLLHIYDEQSAQGKVRILSASYNPSSTFLYQVNERELFAALHRQLEQFALDNSVDLLTVSRNRWIRTNRNEGEFEQAIKGQVAAVNEEVLLRKPQPFCHAFNYQNDILDVTWRRPKVMERFVKWFASWRNRKN